MAKLFKWNVDKIYFYPYGGLTNFNECLNKPKYEELLIMLAGPIIQCLYYLIMMFFLNYREVIMFREYHYAILLFNLLPIYPLDGGKLLNIIINYLLSFKSSLKYTFIISYMFLFGLIFLLLKRVSISLSILLVFGILCTKLLEEYKKRKHYFNKFLLERYLNHYHFKKVRVVHDISQFYRDYQHVIMKKNKSISERECLKDHFKY